MVFTGLYCAFGCIEPMIVWWYVLEIDLMFCEGFLGLRIIHCLGFVLLVRNHCVGFV